MAQVSEIVATAFRHFRRLSAVKCSSKVLLIVANVPIIVTTAFGRFRRVSAVKYYQRGPQMVVKIPEIVATFTREVSKAQVRLARRSSAK